MEIPKCTHMCSCNRYLIVFLNWLQTCCMQQFSLPQGPCSRIFVVHGANLPYRSDVHMCVHHYCNVWRAPCFKTDMHQPSTHICSSFIAAKLTCINLGYTSAAVTRSTFDAWLLQHLTHGNWFVQQNCCTNDAAMYGGPLCSSFVAQTNYRV